MIIDLIVLILLIAFSFFGVLEGFLASSLKLTAWILGILSAWLFSNPVATALSANIDGMSPLLAYGLGAILAFICVFFPVRIIARILKPFLKKSSALTFADRILGGILGFLKGAAFSFLILSIVYIVPAKGDLKASLDKSTSLSVYKAVPFSKMWNGVKNLRVES